MKILDGYIDWHVDFANRPSLYLIVDEIPESEKFIYQQNEWAFFAECENCVRFYSWFGWETNENCDGYGGAEIPIKLQNGQRVILKGPWSSNSNAMEEIGFGSSIEVAVKPLNDDLNIYYSICIRPEFLFRYLNKIKPFKNKCPIGYEKIINGKAGFNFIKKEPFVICSNEEIFYKPE